MPKKKDTDHELEDVADRMIRVLSELRRLGTGAYPVTLRELVEQSDLRASDQRVIQAANKRSFTDRVVVGKKDNKPNLDSPVVLKEDTESETIFPTFLKYAMDSCLKTKKGNASTTQAVTPSVLKDKVPSGIQKSFHRLLDQRVQEQTLPDEYAWVLIQNRPRLFRLDKIWPESLRQVLLSQRDSKTHTSDNNHTSVLEPKRDFASAFRNAFQRLDERNGSTNFVTLLDLRQALSDFNRDEFDLGLRQLRAAEQFALDNHEGRHRSLTLEEREAGIQEAGSLLVYVSQR